MAGFFFFLNLLLFSHFKQMTNILDLYLKLIMHFSCVNIKIFLYHSHLHSLSEPQGTLLRLAAVITLWTMACSLRHFTSNISFSVISFIPISCPVRVIGKKGYG